MKKTTNIILATLGALFFNVLFGAILLALIFFLLIGRPDDYLCEANWNCTDESFRTVYYAECSDKMGELKERYDLTFKDKTEFSETSTGNPQIIVTLYDKKYAMKFKFVNEVTVGWYDANLYYFGDLEDVDLINKLTNFLNDFTNFVAYDTEKDFNCFEKLYHEVITEGKTWASKSQHFDDIVGNVGYQFQLDYTAKYINENGAESVEKIKCCIFWFEGILTA